MGKSLIIFWSEREWYDFRAGHWWKRLSLFWERSPVSYPPHACLLMFCLALLPGLDSETMPSTCEESLITFTFSQWTVAFCDNRDLKQRMWQRVLDSWCTLIFVSHCALQETCYSNPELWWCGFFSLFFNDSLNFIRKQVLYRLHINRMTNVLMSDGCTESKGC